MAGDFIALALGLILFCVLGGLECKGLGIVRVLQWQLVSFVAVVIVVFLLCAFFRGVYVTGGIWLEQISKLWVMYVG